MPTARAPVRRYEFRTVLRAPLPFAFRWCTDYSEADPSLEGAHHRRKIVRRSRREVIYEDLEETREGWVWRRTTVAVRPPNRWTARSEGNHRNWILDYTLRPLPDGTSELLWRGERHALPLGGPNPTPAAMLEEMRTIWGRFGRALATEYRAGRRAPVPREQRLTKSPTTPSGTGSRARA